ncbi:MAG: BatA and WFA domain-containing protein [Clostridiales bacterium]|nr:BatA and WFA domain-containing protein [Clostridiales bacterium]
MGIYELWPLAFLALVPVLILLYFLRQNIKKKEFSAVMLWQEVYRSVEATRPWERLRKNLLLILQILTVLLFVLALMRPWIRSGAGDQTMTVLVLDNSASMDTLYGENADGLTAVSGEDSAQSESSVSGKSAVYSGFSDASGSTRLDAAKEAACEYVDSLADGSMLYVVSANQSAALVLSNSQDKVEAKNRIRGIEQTVLGGDLSSSLSLVQSCISQSEEYQMVFFTDTAFDTGDLDCVVENFYSDAANCSADSLSCSEKDGQLLVLAQVTNHGAADVTGEINLYGIDADREEALLSISAMDVAAGETASVYFELEEAEVDETVKALRAEINGTDALAGDNSVWCVLEEESASRVLLLTQSNLYLEKAFGTISGVEVYRTSDLGVFETSEADGYDLYIFDGMLPEELPETGNYLFVNCKTSAYAGTESTAASDADENVVKNTGNSEVYFAVSGYVENTTLEVASTDMTYYSADASFGVTQSAIYETPSWGTSFLKAGESGEETAGFYGIYGGHRMAVLGFDLHDTDFGLQAEFPILVSEMAGYLLDTGLTEDTSYVAGDSILIHGQSTGSDLTVIRPDQSTELITASEAAGSYMEVSQLGIYQISQEQGETRKTQYFAVQFPTALESEVEPASAMENAQEGAAESSGVGTMELRNLVLILLLILMCAEWLIYVRTS